MFRDRFRAFGVAAATAAGLALHPGAAAAWVAAHIEGVDASLEIAADGAAASLVTVRYVVEAGRFREFRVHGIHEDVELDLGASWAESDKGRRHAIEIAGRRTPDGTLRLRLVGGGFIGRGRATCRLAMRENLFASGRAKSENGRILVDWAPPVFPDGMGRMTVVVEIVGDGPDPEFHVEPDLVPILEPRASGRRLVLSKFRPAQFFAMPVRFAMSGAVVAVPETPSRAEAPAAARVHRSVPPAGPERRDARPLLVLLAALGLTLPAARARHAGRVAAAAGGRAAHLLFPGLGAPLRWPLAAGALAAGTWLLSTGRAPWGIVVHAAAMLLVLPDRFRWIDRGPAAAGQWRALAAPSPRTWRSLAAAARRARRSLLDATGPAGCILMLAAAGAVAAACRLLLWPDVAGVLAVAADAVVLILPPFVAAPERALPPVLPAESGVALERVRRRVTRRPGNEHDVSFLIRDDSSGRPADLRMRVRSPGASANREAEVAVEWRSTTWGWCPSFAVLLRLPAGSVLRAGDSRCARGAVVRLAADLRSETWVFRAATARAAAAAIADALETAESLSAPEAAGARAPRPQAAHHA